MLKVQGPFMVYWYYRSNWLS